MPPIYCEWLKKTRLFGRHVFNGMTDAMNYVPTAATVDVVPTLFPLDCADFLIATSRQQSSGSNLQLDGPQASPKLPESEMALPSYIASIGDDLFEPTITTCGGNGSSEVGDAHGGRRVLGVYLAYYEAYGVAGVRTFQSFLNSLDAGADLIVSCNGSVLSLLANSAKHVIQGSNVLREFSGWDTALNYARSLGMELDNYLIVFANDTFCQHNNFGPVSRFAFSRAFRRLLNGAKDAAFAGELWSFGGTYEVDGLRSDRWVSTYFFAISGKTVNKMGSLCPDLPIERFYVAESGQLCFTELVSQNLARRVRSWLSGRGTSAWRNRAEVDVSKVEGLRGKATSIICEKFLSAKVLAHGGEFIDVFESRWIKQLRRLETLYARAKKRQL